MPTITFIKVFNFVLGFVNMSATFSVSVYSKSIESLMDYCFFGVFLPKQCWTIIVNNYWVSEEFWFCQGPQ